MRKYIQGAFRQFCFLMIAPLLIAFAGPAAFAQLTKVGKGEGRVDIVAWPGYIERGEYSPSLVLALRIASVLGTSIEEIFWLDEENDV